MDGVTGGGHPGAPKMHRNMVGGWMGEWVMAGGGWAAGFDDD